MRMLLSRSSGVCRATTSTSAPLESNVASTCTLPHRLLYTAPSTTVVASAVAAGVVLAVADVLLGEAESEACVVDGAVVVGAMVVCAAEPVAAAVVAPA